MTYKYWIYLSTVSFGFYYLFYTVIFQGDDVSTIEAICSDIFDINRDECSEEEFDDARNLIYQHPPLHDVWLY